MEPGDDDADEVGQEEGAEDPAVEPLALELVGDERHHRRNGKRFEGDGDDVQQQPAAEAPQLRTPRPAGSGFPQRLARRGRPCSHLVAPPLVRPVRRRRCRDRVIGRERG
jgi:hypothetical protein